MLQMAFLWLDASTHHAPPLAIKPDSSNIYIYNIIPVLYNIYILEPDSSQGDLNREVSFKRESEESQPAFTTGFTLINLLRP